MLAIALKIGVGLWPVGEPECALGDVSWNDRGVRSERRKELGERYKAFSVMV